MEFQCNWRLEWGQCSDLYFSLIHWPLTRCDMILSSRCTWGGENFGLWELHEKPRAGENSLTEGEWGGGGYKNTPTCETGVRHGLTLMSSLQSSGAQSSRVFLQATRRQATESHTQKPATWLGYGDAGCVCVRLCIKYTEQCGSTSWAVQT